MNSVSRSTSSIDISESEMANDDERYSTTTLFSSLSIDLDSSPRYEDIDSCQDEDWLDVDDYYTNSESDSPKTNWTVDETPIQINGSVVIVPPSIKQELKQKEQEKDTTANDDLRISSPHHDSDPLMTHPRENKLTSIIEKLARNGVTVSIISNESPIKSSYNSMKMRNSSTCSKRYNPLLPRPTSYQNIPLSKNHHINQTEEKEKILLETNEVQMQPRRLFSDCPKASKKFVCNFCDRLFKSLECLKSHLEIHCISYWRTPYSRMEETHSANNSDSDEIHFKEILDYPCEEGFTCQVCDMIFASVAGLSKHMDIHRIPYTKIGVEDNQESISEEGYAMIDLTD